MQALKKQLVDLNRDLFMLEEELLFPASTQVAVFLSMDVGTFFALDSVTLKLDDKEVANYLYTEREVEALHRGGVQKLYLGNLKAGQHELVAFFTGKGPHDRDYRRGATLSVRQGQSAPSTSSCASATARRRCSRSSSCGSGSEAGSAADDASQQRRRDRNPTVAALRIAARAASRRARPSSRPGAAPARAGRRPAAARARSAISTTATCCSTSSRTTTSARWCGSRLSRDFDRMPHHDDEAELLSGGLYLSLGLHAEADAIFDRLLAGSGAAVGARPRVLLPRPDRLPARLLRRGLAQPRSGYAAPLPGSLEAERRLLAANVLMALGRYGEAAAQLQAAGRDTTTGRDYARFNLGVALVRAGDVAQGQHCLERVGTMPAGNEEQRALRDRANLALGFALLQQRERGAGRRALSRVRLDGPFTNKALLGLGWAEADAKRPERALVPWLELRERTTARRGRAGILSRRALRLRRAGVERAGAQQYRFAVQTPIADESTAHRRVDRGDPPGRVPRLDPRGGAAQSDVGLVLAARRRCRMRRTRATSITCWRRTSSRKA